MEKKEKWMEEQEISVENGTEKTRKTKWENLKIYQAQGLAAFIVIAAGLLVYFCLLRLSVFTSVLGKILHALSPAICGFIFAFLMTPFVRILEKYLYRAFSRKRMLSAEKDRKLKKRSRKLAILIAIVTTITIIVLLLIAIIPEFINSIDGLVKELPNYGKLAMSNINHFLSRNEKIYNMVAPYLNNYATYMENWVSNYLTSIVSTAYEWLTTGISAAFRVLYNFLIGLIVSVYLLADKEYFIGICKKATFALLPKKTAKNLVQTLHKANNLYSRAILGKMLDSTVIGLICFIGACILGCFFDTIAEYRVLVSIIVGITNVIPFFGPYIGGVPCTLLIMCMNPLHGLIFGGFLIVLQQFDCNFLDPHIVGKSVGLKPLFVLIACMLGASLFGIVGLLVAVPTFAMVYSILKSSFELKLEHKQLPKETIHYMETPGAIIVKQSVQNSDATEAGKGSAEAETAAEQENKQ